MAIGFPTQGKLIKFAFDATGILPRKRGEVDGLSETEKKSIQTALKRLTSEDGKFNDLSGKMIQKLAFIVAGSITNAKIVLAMGDIAFDLFDVHQEVVRDDGSYLTTTETVRWFTSSYVIHRLVLSVNKHLLRYNIPAEGFLVPDDHYWFLPTIEGDTVTWPLKKVMDWAYAICATNQKNFYCPGSNTSDCSFEQRQNLENAENWLAGKNFPSWHALRWNFSRSLDLLRSRGEADHRREISEQSRQSITVALFIARVATYVCREIQAHFGNDYLFELVQQYQRYSAWMADDLACLAHGVEDHMSQNSLPSEAADAVWWSLSERYWSWFAERAAHFSHTLDKISAGGNSDKIPEETTRSLIGHYGRFTVSTLLEFIERQQRYQPPEGFAEAICTGFELKSNVDATDADIDLFSAKIKEWKVEALLSWIEPWLRAVVRYRREDFEGAFCCLQIALDRAKYCAGREQYNLVNQYVELSAKTDRWREFKKGIEWAQYLGIEIRFLRKDDPTEGNLRAVFEIMKRARYADL